MQSFKSLIFSGSVFFAISFFNIPLSCAIPECPKGYTYNMLTTKCEAEPICVNGFYDSGWDFCNAPPTHTCNSGEYDYNQVTKQCEAQPYCCASAFLVHPPNVSQYCDEGHGPPCSCPGYGGIDDNGKGVCRRVPNCPDNGTLYDWNTICLGSQTITCPQDYGYWGLYDLCYKTPTCPPGGDFLRTYDLCKASPYPDEKNSDCKADVGKPVNVAVGTVTATEVDFSLKGVMPSDFIRYHDSKTATSTVVRSFGRTWGHQFDSRVMSYAASIYKFIELNGTVIYYSDSNGDKIYEADIPRDVTSVLIKNADNSFTRKHKNGATEEFNTAGYKTALIDGNGNRTTLTRDAGNKLTRISDPSGREILLAYNTSNYISQITLPDNKVVTYTYVAATLQRVTYPDGTYKTYEYSGYRLTGIKNENNSYVEKHTYDAQGRGITSSADGTNEKLTINYISDTQSTVTDSLGRVTTYTIDKTGGKSRPTSISGPGCSECGQSNVSYTYDANLNVTSKTDANGAVAVMTYDTKGNMLTKTEAYGTSQQRMTTYTYEPTFNQVASVTDPKGNITTYGYDSKGNLISITDATGATTTFVRNPQGLITQITDADGTSTGMTYDQYGNIATVSDALGHTSTYTHDLMGTLLSVTDAKGNQTTYTYDLRKRLKQVTDSLSGTTTYTYDPAGNLTALTDAKGNITQYSYDTINRLMRETTPLNKQVSYTYDSQSNLKTMTDIMGRTTIYTYDSSNRVTLISHPDGTQTTFGYDALGNLTSASNANIAYSLVYDSLNRLITVTDSFGATLHYTFDQNSNRTGLTDPAGTVTHYTYSPLNSVTSITDPFGQVNTYTYDSLGRRALLALPNTITTGYSYDILSRLTAINSAPSSISYNYDPVGNRTSKTDSSGAHSYVYDPKYQLTQATHPNIPAEQYSYDPVGNRLNTTVNAGNRLLEDSAYTYAYDDNGNLTQKTSKATGTVTTFAYDTENRLTQVTYPGMVAQYKYDPFGRRIQKNINGAITRYVYDNEDILFETDGSGVVTTEYIHGPGIDEPTAMIRGGQAYYYHADALGSITSITDASGNVVQRYEYDSFGNITSTLNPNFVQPYTYTGREYDPETGLYFYRARYYDPKVGRFISEDPIGFEGGINKFVYVGNDPINYTDPYGEIAPVVGAAVCLTAIGVGFVNWWYWATHPPVICPPGDECIIKPDKDQPKWTTRPRPPIVIMPPLGR